MNRRYRTTSPLEGEIGSSEAARLLGIARDVLRVAKVYARVLRPRTEALPSGKIRRWYRRDAVVELAAARVRGEVALVNMGRENAAEAPPSSDGASCPSPINPPRGDS
nr:hypothetical protein [Kofleriaceae bacterium]